LNFRGTDPLQIANQLSTFQVEEEALATLPDRGPPPRGGGSRASGDRPTQAEVAAEARDNEREVSQSMKRESSGAARKRIEKQVDALGELAKMLRTIPGRKQVIFLSEGFDATLLQGRNAHADVVEQKRTTDQKNDNERTLTGQEWAVDTDARYGSMSGLTILDRMASYFRSSDVMLHAIDIKGVRVQNDVVEGATIN